VGGPLPGVFTSFRVEREKRKRNKKRTDGRLEISTASGTSCRRLVEGARRHINNKRKEKKKTKLQKEK
jgi:hypothetical protein